MQRWRPWLLLGIGVVGALAAARSVPSLLGDRAASNVLVLSGNIEAHESIVAFKTAQSRLVLIVGNGVRLVVDDAARRVPELRARLERGGVPFAEVAAVAPTFEDVFGRVERGGRRRRGAGEAVRDVHRRRGRALRRPPWTGAFE